MIGESGDAFFTLKDFINNRVLEQCFRPPTLLDLSLENDLGNRVKNPDKEVRLVVVDYAFADTTSKEKNDQTNIQLISGHWKKGRFERHWNYAECHRASDSLGAARRVRELYFDFCADYIVCDLRNGGETLYNLLGEPWDHPQRGSKWNPHGLTVSSRKELHVVPDAKLEDLRSRTKDKDPIPCIIPIVATGELNHIMWLDLKKQLTSLNCKFLISEADYQSTLEDDGTFYNLTSEELADKLLPYIETTAMIYEAINLKSDWKNDRLKLIEPRSGTKDKAVVCSYGNYIISKLEMQWLRSIQAKEDTDYDDIQLIW